jgi:hypothetical protein
VGQRSANDPPEPCPGGPGHGPAGRRARAPVGRQPPAPGRRRLDRGGPRRRSGTTRVSGRTRRCPTSPSPKAAIGPRGGRYMPDSRSHPDPRRQRHDRGPLALPGLDRGAIVFERCEGSHNVPRPAPTRLARLALLDPPLAHVGACWSWHRPGRSPPMSTPSSPSSRSSNQGLRSSLGDDNHGSAHFRRRSRRTRGRPSRPCSSSITRDHYPEARPGLGADGTRTSWPVT